MIANKRNTTIILNRSNQLFTKFGVVPLVEEQLVADLVDDDVPRVVGTGAAHQRGQNGVRGVHIALSLGQLTDDRVVGGGHRVENAVHALQRLLVLAVDAVVRLVVELQLTTAHTVYKNLIIILLKMAF
jgi:hypothetical protein